MSEEIGGGAEEVPVIELPSRIRIRQRLGQVAVENELADRIERFGNQEIAADELVDQVEATLVDYAEKKKFGILSLALRDMPLILNTLVDDPDSKAKVLDIWGERVKEREVEDERINTIKRDLTSTKKKLPRKIKKAEKKEGAQRGMVRIDPRRFKRS